MAEPSLIWETGDPGPAIVRRVLGEIQDLDVAKPSDLLFHIVLLSEDMDGPSVTVHGRPGSKAYHCHYDARTEWVTPVEARDG